jgi:hypothetical protein
VCDPWLGPLLFILVSISLVFAMKNSTIKHRWLSMVWNKKNLATINNKVQKFKEILQSLEKWTHLSFEQKNSPSHIKVEV